MNLSNFSYSLMNLNYEYYFSFSYRKNKRNMNQESNLSFKLQCFVPIFDRVSYFDIFVINNSNCIVLLNCPVC